jgi:hypothetical protein
VKLRLCSSFITDLKPNVACGNLVNHHQSRNCERCTNHLVRSRKNLVGERRKRSPIRCNGKAVYFFVNVTCVSVTSPVSIYFLPAFTANFIAVVSGEPFTFPASGYLAKTTERQKGFVPKSAACQRRLPT